MWVRVPPLALNAFVAQLVERFTCNEDVAGSTPVKGSKIYMHQWSSGLGIRLQSVMTGVQIPPGAQTNAAA